jgi:hypothetical protein
MYFLGLGAPIKPLNCHRFGEAVPESHFSEVKPPTFRSEIVAKT